MIWAWILLVATVGFGFVAWDALRRRCPCFGCCSREFVDSCRLDCRAYQQWTDWQ